MKPVEQELKDQAKEKGYAVNQGFPGPIYLIMNRFNGQTIGKFKTLEQVEAALATLEPVAPVKIEAVPVGWSFEPTSPPKQYVRPCPNGYGPTCLCLDKSFFYFCPVIGCNRQAKCLGACDEHFAHVKVWGKQIQDRAIEATEEMINEYLPEDPDGLSTYERAISNLDKGIYTYINIKYAEMRKTDDAPTADEKGTLAHMPGVILRTVDGLYTLFDKDANILSQHHSKEELLALFTFE